MFGKRRGIGGVADGASSRAFFVAEKRCLYAENR